MWNDESLFCNIENPSWGEKMNQTVCKNFQFQNPFTDDAYILPLFLLPQSLTRPSFSIISPLFNTVCNLNDGLKWQFTQIERLEDSIGLNKNLLENQSRYPRAIAHPSTVKVELIAKLTFFQDWKLGTRFWQKLFKSVLTKGLF